MNRFTLILGEIFSFLLFLGFYIAAPVVYLINEYFLKVESGGTKIATIGMIILFIGFIVGYKHIKKFVENLADGWLKIIITGTFKITPILAAYFLIRMSSESIDYITILRTILYNIFVSMLIGTAFYASYMWFNMKSKEAKNKKQTTEVVTKTNQVLLEELKKVMKPTV